MIEVKCYNCGKKLKRKPCQTKKGKKYTCSVECHKETFKTGKTVKCGTCGNDVYRTLKEFKKSKKHFCNKSCAATYNNLNRKLDSKYSYRKKAFKNFKKECNRCGWDKIEKILEVHHKDRDRDNHELSNLEILCPNCHLSEHYYKGDGRFKKKREYKKVKSGSSSTG